MPDTRSTPAALAALMLSGALCLPAALLVLWLTPVGILGALAVYAIGSAALTVLALVLRPQRKLSVPLGERQHSEV